MGNPAKQEIEDSNIHIYIAVGKPAKQEFEETTTLIYIAVGNPAKHEIEDTTKLKIKHPYLYSGRETR